MMQKGGSILITLRHFMIPVSLAAALLASLAATAAAGPTVPGKDLFIDSVPAMNPPVIPPGGTSSLSSWRVRNRGTLSTGVPFTNGYYLSVDRSLSVTADVNIGGNSNPVLAGDGGSTIWPAVPFTFPAVTPEGTYYVCIYADNTNRVAEAYENNNVAVARVIVSRRPDLTITSGPPTLTTTTLEAGRPFTLGMWTLRNQGPGIAGPFYNAYYLSPDPTITNTDVMLGGNYNPGMTGGASTTWPGVTLSIPGSTASGTYYLGTLADRTAAVPEADESNNFVARQVTVRGGPDLRIVSPIVINQAAMRPGEYINYPAFTITNAGAMPTSNFNIDIFVSTDTALNAGDQVLAEYVVTAGLQPGQTVQYPATRIQIPSARAQGWNYLGLALDSTQRIVETNENNNTAYNRFYLSFWPDVTPGPMPDAMPSTIFAGGQVRVGPVAVTNTGDLDLINPFDCRFYLSTDRTITTADTPLGTGEIPIATLNRGATFTIPAQNVTIPFGTKAGSYYVGILADSTGRIAERFETDNGSASAHPISVWVP